MSERPGMTEELEVLAAEHGLGLLEGGEKLRATALEISNPQFASRVAQWREQGNQWMKEVDPIPVDEAVWQRLAPIFDETHRAPAPPPATPPMRAANDTAANDLSDGKDSAKMWQQRTYVAIAASMVLAVLLGTVLSFGSGNLTNSGGTGQLADAGNGALPANAVQEVAIAQIAGADGSPLISAAFDPDGGNLRLRVADFNAADKAPELWVLNAAGTPYSLGLVEGRELTVTIDPDLQDLLVEGAVIAVTLENRDTAPHDAPTGAILGTGQLVIM